jgi:alpha-tubulin N-acetyltransferase 1
MVGERKCLGFLKTGKRNLFIRNEGGLMKEIKPMCVLDFYVHESVQRNGIGKVLFK